MVVVVIIAILAVIALPGLLGNTKDLAVYQAAQRVAELVQGGRSRALATGSAHAIVFSTNGAGTLGTLPGKFAVQQGVREIPGVAPAGPTRVPVSSCRTAGAFPVNETLVFANDERLIDYNIRVTTITGVEAGTAGVGGEMWVCYTPTGRAYIASSAGGLPASQPLLSPVMINIQRFEGATPAGLVRSVVLTPGSAPRIFSR
jgi:Tfp pilus assembly protein FimT